MDSPDKATYADSQPPLDDDDDPNEIELAWQEEIERRVKAIHDGTAEFVTEEEFWQGMREARNQ